MSPLVTTAAHRPGEAGDGPVPGDPTRWVRILDRIEHRQADVGLRYSLPPLWLEVTMTGPDADRWPALDDVARSWDWQSVAPCREASDLELSGAGDDELLAAVGRYTVENLVLNAVHEIGEWLRYDGCRVFPAHLPRRDDAGPWEPSADGNGVVRVTASYPDATTAPLLPVDEGAPMGPTGELADGLVAALDALAGPASRFTYLPGIVIGWDAHGPVITRDDGGRGWRSAWSDGVLAAARTGCPALGLVGALRRDIHSALVRSEADRVCRSFHIDGRRVWTLTPGPHPGAQSPEGGLRPLVLSVTYAGGRPVGPREG